MLAARPEENVLNHGCTDLDPRLVLPYCPCHRNAEGCVGIAIRAKLCRFALAGCHTPVDHRRNESGHCLWRSAFGDRGVAVSLRNVERHGAGTA